MLTCRRVSEEHVFEQFGSDHVGSIDQQWDHTAYLGSRFRKLDPTVTQPV